MTKPIRSIVYDIEEGNEGIYQTVDYMWNYALRDSKAAEVKALVKSLKSTTDIGTIGNIYQWVVNHVRYKLDPADREMVTAPIHYVNGNRHTGDCDCMTTLLVCLLEAAGFECAITVIAWRIKAYTHVFAEVKYEGKWHVLDPTLGKDGFGKQDKEITNFKRITKKDMAKLQVLADGNTTTTPTPLLENEGDRYKKYPPSQGGSALHSNGGVVHNALRQNRRRCVGRNCGHHDDDNDNKNIINVNVINGDNTATSNSHNREELQANRTNSKAYSVNEEHVRNSKPVRTVPMPYANKTPRHRSDATPLYRGEYEPTVLVPQAGGMRRVQMRATATTTNNGLQPIANSGLDAVQIAGKTKQLISSEKPINTIEFKKRTSHSYIEFP